MPTSAAAVLVITMLALPAGAQSILKSAPSTRATAEVTLAPPRVEGQPAPVPSKIRIDYGQPHARGRVVEGALTADLDTVWRMGANSPTTLTTDVDLIIGGTSVPKGQYALYAQTSSRGPWTLIVSRDLGATYAAGRDVGRVPLTSKVLPASIESLTISLVPAADNPNGDLRIIWGNREFTTTWAVK
ncbi:MAG: DUF2911 domain-containing protein [Gemmatimonadaceae bacterium]